MAFTHVIENPIYGISSVPEIARPEGFCDDQINWYNDPVRGMTRRASSRLLGEPLTPPMVKIHAIESFEDGAELKTFVFVQYNATQYALYDWSAGINDTPIAGTIKNYPAGWSKDHKYSLDYIDKSLYIIDRDVDVQINEYAEYNGYTCISSVLVPNAIGYAEEVSVKLIWRKLDGSEVVILEKASYKSIAYDGLNQADADASRAREKVITELTTELTKSYTSPFGGGAKTLQVFSNGGSIDIMFAETDMTNAHASEGFLVAEVESSNLGIAYSQTDSIIAFNSTVTTVANLPLYSTARAVRKIQADPRDDRGAYYLRPSPIGNTPVGNTVMADVSWVETVAPAEKASFISSSLPIVYNPDSVTPFAHMVLKDRPAGDKLTNKNPSFVGAPIKGVCGSQERIGLLSRDKICWSKTDDYEQMWRTSAVQVLSTDGFSVGNAGATSDFEHVTTHNKSLLVISPQQQCKLNGVEPLALGVSMPVATSTQVDTSVKPISIGSRVYLPTKLANSAGLLEYTTINSTGVDDVESITDHVKGVLRGNILSLSGSDSSDLLAIRSDGTSSSEIAICNINSNDSDNKVWAWSRWDIPDLNVIHIVVREESVRVLGWVWADTLQVTKYYVSLDISTYYNPYDIYNRVCLDYRTTWIAPSDGAEYILPTGYPLGGVIVIPMDGDTPLIAEPAARAGNTVTFNSKVGVTYCIGKRYNSLLKLSKIYRYDQYKRPIVTDRLRLLHLIVQMDEMYRMFMRIDSKYYDVDDEWMVAESEDNMDTLYQLQPYTGEYRFGVSMLSTDCNLILGTDYELSGTITGIAYRGNMIRTG